MASDSMLYALCAMRIVNCQLSKKGCVLPVFRGGVGEVSQRGLCIFVAIIGLVLLFCRDGDCLLPAAIARGVGNLSILLTLASSSVPSSDGVLPLVEN